MLDGYESPINIFIKNDMNDIIEERDNFITTRIIEEVGLDINKDELIKALAYDRDQYNRGYINGEIAGYKRGYEDALEKMDARLKELISFLDSKKEVNDGSDKEIT